MKSKSSANHIKHLDIIQYLRSLWVIPVMLLLVQSIIRLTDNPIITHVPSWIFFLSPLMFIIIFAGTAYWAHQPIRLSMRAESHEPLELAMASLPMRALKAFGVAGLISVIYILLFIFFSSSLSDHSISPRMMFALILSISFGLGVLTPALAVALTMSWMAKTRKRLSMQNLFIGDLEHFHNYPWLIRSGNRPWLIFGITSLLPVSILAVFSWLMLGTSDAEEQNFILMQAVVVLFDLVAGGAAIVWITSKTVHRITRELAMGLNFLRQGKFDGHVAIMVDDDMGELARGLNTALAGLKERDSLKDSLSIASDIQKGLMPRGEPNISGYSVSGFQQSCHTVGGDYYDYVECQNGSIWLIIADVAGKGYPAALTVANLQAMLHALANGGNISLLDAATYINKSLHQSLQGGRFVTLFIAELNPNKHTLQWINAGHIPPLLWQKEKLIHLEATSPPLGMLETLSLHTEETPLYKEDSLFACTDGITEARNASDDMFGDQRVEEWFKKHYKLDASILPSSILACLDEQGFHKRDDDITMLCLKRSSYE